jgi:hypothetical protein
LFRGEGVDDGIRLPCCHVALAFNDWRLTFGGGRNIFGNWRGKGWQNGERTTQARKKSVLSQLGAVNS